MHIATHMGARVTPLVLQKFLLYISSACQSGGYSGCPVLLVGTSPFIVLTNHQCISTGTENSPLGSIGDKLNPSPEAAQIATKKDNSGPCLLCLDHS